MLSSTKLLYSLSLLLALSCVTTEASKVLALEPIEVTQKSKDSPESIDIQALRKQLERTKNLNYTVEAPISDFFQKVQFVEPGKLCIDFLGGCNGNKKSYVDYLELRTQLIEADRDRKSVNNIFYRYAEGLKINSQPESQSLYNKLDNLTKEKSQDINEDLKNLGFKTITLDVPVLGKQSIGLSLGNPLQTITDALQGSVNLVGSGLKGSIKLAPGIITSIVAFQSQGTLSLSEISSLKNTSENLTLSGEELQKRSIWLSDTYKTLDDLAGDFTQNKGDISKIDTTKYLAQTVKSLADLEDMKGKIPTGAGLWATIQEVRSKIKDINELDADLKNLRKRGVLTGSDELYIQLAKISALMDIESRISSSAQDIAKLSGLDNTPIGKKLIGRFGDLQTIVDSLKGFLLDEAGNFSRDETLRSGYSKLLETKKINEVLAKRGDEFLSSSSDLINSYENSRLVQLDETRRLQVSSMQSQLTSITQGGSTHIGSAAYYLGRSTQDDKIETDATIAGRIYQNNSPRVQSPQQASQYIPADSITNLKAPVDIVLRWDQPTRNNLLLDLDSHLTGPTSLGVDSPIRFHTRFDSRGSTSEAPFAELYKDVRPDQGTFCSEQTRIQVLQENGIYRFYVHDYTNRNSTQSTDLSNSGANVSVHNGLGLTTAQARDTVGPIIGSPILVPTNQGGNVWYVLQLDSKTGILRRVNVPFIYESDRTKVPRIGER